MPSLHGYLVWDNRSIKLLRKRSYSIGRGSTSDIKLNDKTISRIHCYAEWKGNHIYIKDNSSTNGTLLNGEKITTAAARNGDTIRMGNTIISVRITSNDDATFAPSDTFVMERKLETLLDEVHDPGIINRIKEIKKMFEQKKQKLTELAFKDGLTKLYNRRYFNRELDQEIERTKRYKTQITLIFMDIDHFKKLNDTYGHQKGDKVLKVIGHFLVNNCRSNDIPCRYGGEELAIILPETDLKKGVATAEKLRQQITIITQQTEKLKVTVSIGVAEYSQSNSTSQLLIKAADELLYKAKKSGRNKVCSKLDSL